MRKFLVGVALAAIASAPVAVTAASAAPVPARGQSWASMPVAERGQSWVAIPEVVSYPYAGTATTVRKPVSGYSTGPVLPQTLLDPDRNGNSRDAHTNGLSDMPPSIVTPHIVCFRVGNGFCWIPWVW